MDIYDFKKIHCIGIGGVGVSAIAKFFVVRGARVTGSDVVASDITRDLATLGIMVTIGHKASNVPPDTELIIHSPAITEQNEEYVCARKLGITLMNYPEVLGEISRTRPTFAVTGMHGKSTTTAMLGLIFKYTDPLVIVGSRVKEFSHGNLQNTTSTTSRFVVEACEYRGHMRNLSPRDIVITNIEEEHMDYYRDIDHIKTTFQEFVDKMSDDGQLFVNADNAHAMSITCRGKRVTYGMNEGADVRGIPHKFENGVRNVDLYVQGIHYGYYTLRLPGTHNVMNSLAALACGLHNGISFDEAADSVAHFNGIWRRFELVGTHKGIPVYSDYGHHPSEIIATLQGARELYPNRRVVLLFQPHQYDRTKKLFDEFIPALVNADRVIIADVYDVVGREEEREVNAEMLAAACHSDFVTYGGDLDRARDVLLAEVSDGDVIIIMGAGDVDRVAREIV